MRNTAPETVKEKRTYLEELSVAQLLHCRVRYLTDGVIIGGREFVDKMLTESGQFSALRKKRGARQMRSVFIHRC